MTTMKRLVTVMLVAALAAVPFAGAQGDAGPEAREDGKNVVLENDRVTVWFQGKKPFLKVFPTGSTNDSDAFTIKFHRLVEYEDANGNGAPDPDEVDAFLDLEGAKAWDVQLGADGEAARINLTLVDTVKLKGPADGLDVGVPTREANVSLVFHAFPDATTLTTDSGVNVTVPADHVKYDVVVAAWPWLDAQTHRLAITALTSAALTEARVGDTGVATVADNGTTLGALMWIDTAEGVTADGEHVPVNVTAAIEEAQDADGASLTRVSFTYDAPNLRSLVHDPTIGVASTSAGGAGEVPDLGARVRDVPAPGAALAVGTIALAAVAVAHGARRRG